MTAKIESNFGREIMKKYSVSKGWDYYSENSVFTRKEILDIYNDRRHRQESGLFYFNWDKIEDEWICRKCKDVCNFKYT